MQKFLEGSNSSDYFILFFCSYKTLFCTSVVIQKKVWFSYIESRRKQSHPAADARASRPNSTAARPRGVRSLMSLDTARAAGASVCVSGKAEERN